MAECKSELLMSGPYEYICDLEDGHEGPHECTFDASWVDAGAQGPVNTTGAAKIVWGS